MFVFGMVFELMVDFVFLDMFEFECLREENAWLMVECDKVGSMVVFGISGPITSQYRKFNIKTVVGQSDVDSLAEVMGRRLQHPEWPLPQIFLIDGGRAQVNKIKAVLEAHRCTIPVVGIAKGPERKRNDFILGSKDPSFITWIANHQNLLIKVRDEAHRFAITFNRSKRVLKKRLKK
jgi:excinuclease ABC subunit C